MSDDELKNSPKLGELLTSARKKLEFSQKEIASKLNLKEEIVAALDANAFDKLPAPTYVMGYIRSYARAVNLDPDILISIYEGVDEAPPEILPDVKPPVQASSKDRPVQAMTYLITFTLVILIIAWWQSQYIVSTDIFSNNDKTSQGGEYPGGFTYTYDIVIHPEIIETEVSENEELTTIPNTGATSKVSNISLESEKMLSTEGPSNLINTQVATDNTLSMEISAESWIEVYDALGEKLYLDLAKPGRKISLTGAAPFSVKLGNAKAVSVNFNGKTFDTSKYTKAGVARFLLE